MVIEINQYFCRARHEWQREREAEAISARNGGFEK
jgi:hypothetical protein